MPSLRSSATCKQARLTTTASPHVIEPGFRASIVVLRVLVQVECDLSSTDTIPPGALLLFSLIDRKQAESNTLVGNAFYTIFNSVLTVVAASQQNLSRLHVSIGLHAGQIGSVSVVVQTCSHRCSQVLTSPLPPDAPHHDGLFRTLQGGRSV